MGRIICSSTVTGAGPNLLEEVEESEDGRRNTLFLDGVHVYNSPGMARARSINATRAGIGFAEIPFAPLKLPRQLRASRYARQLERIALVGQGVISDEFIKWRGILFGPIPDKWQRHRAESARPRQRADTQSIVQVTWVRRLSRGLNPYRRTVSIWNLWSGSRDAPNHLALGAWR